MIYEQLALFDLPRTLPPGAVPARVDQAEPHQILAGLEVPPPPEPYLPARAGWPFWP